MTEKSKGYCHQTVPLRGCPTRWPLKTRMESLELSEDAFSERSRADGNEVQSRSQRTQGLLRAEHHTCHRLPKGTGFYFRK